MPRWEQTPIVGGSYKDDTRPFSVQDTVNLIPVMAERDGTRSASMLRCAPGYSDFADLGTNAPIRGMRNVEGLFLVVSGTNLFSIAANGTKKTIGTIPGVGRVSMAHNQVTGGNEVAIANGTSGYVYNTVTGVLERISDEGFPGAKVFEFIDSYIAFVEPGGRFAGTSDLADALSYNTLDRFEAEGLPDKIVGLIASHGELFLFGERSTEVFNNTGAATGTFQRADGKSMEVGAASPYAISKLDNSVIWLGSDGVVYRANGYTPLRISTYPIEQAISRSKSSTAFSFTHEDRGHKIFYLTFQDGHTWGYDVATQEWHRRQSKGLDRWRINDLVLWNGKWIAGDFSNGKLYVLDWNVQSEAGIELERMRVSGVLADSQNPIIVNAVELVFDTGQPQKDPAVPMLTISGNAPDGYIGDAYAFAGYAASGGAPPYTFSISAGSLPIGLGPIDQVTGAIAGSPTSQQISPFTVRVQDALGNTASIPDSITIFLESMEDAVMSDEPLLYWPLNAASGNEAIDLSGNGFDAQVLGGFVWGVDGLRTTTTTSGILLESGTLGGSPIDVGSLTEWAIEAVVRLDQPVTAVGYNPSIAVQWRSPNLGRYNAGLFFNKRLDGTSHVFGGMADEVDQQVVDQDPVVLGVRYHFLVTKMDGVLYLYRNGVLSETLPSPSENSRSDGAGFVMGGPTPGYFPESSGWVGEVSNIAVYEHGLTAARAMAHAVASGVIS